MRNGRHEHEGKLISGLPVFIEAIWFCQPANVEQSTFDFRVLGERCQDGKGIKK